MNKTEFLEKIKDILQTEETIDLNTNLLAIEEWDSLSMISMVAFLDKEFNKKVTVQEMQDIDTIEDIAKILGVHFE